MATDTRSPAASSLALISAAALALEVFLTKLLSYALHDWLLYVVLGLAMVGFGAGGTLATLRPNWRHEQVLPHALAWSCVATGVSTLVAYATFLRVVVHVPPTEPSLATIAITGLLSLPFLTAGLAIALALSAAGPRPGRVYAANLIGSGLGGALPLALLGPVSGPEFLALVIAMAGVAACVYAWPLSERPRALTIAAPGTIALAAAAFLGAPALFPVPADPTGSAELLREHATQKGIGVEKKFDRWNATGRIEVYAYSGVPDQPEPYPMMFYVQDASAGSLLVRWDGQNASERGRPARGEGSEVGRNCTETLWGQAYYEQRKDVLVIGLGGGPDVQCALYNEAQSVQVVEINPLSLELVHGPFNEWLGGIGTDPRVNYRLVDGRSFVHTVEPETYDLVQLTGVDTKHLLPSGALALTENPLYTREAFVDYLRALRPGGTLSLIRFSEMEMIRFANTALESLRELGVENPERNIVVLQSGPLLYGILISKKPFDVAQLKALRLHVGPTDYQGLRVFIYELFGGKTHVRPRVVHQPGGPSQKVFADFFEQVGRGDTTAFEQNYPASVAPATDDRPFFFDYTRYDLPDFWAQPHIRMLLGLLASILILAIACILAPLGFRSWRQKQRPRGRAFAVVPVFFGGIGLAYLLIEVWLLHRFSMYLGHQTYAMSLVLGSLLVCSGIGAIMGERWIPSVLPRTVAGIGGASIVLVFAALAGPALLEASWGAGIWVRVLLSLSILAPAGLLMGFPFPAGLAWIAHNHPGAAAWCVGINSFASVVATVAATSITLFWGYTMVLIMGLGCYLVALLAAVLLGRLNS